MTAAGTVENVVALYAQMMSDPATSIKLVTQKPHGHEITKEGIEACLRHAYDDPSIASHSRSSESWTTFDQTEFAESGQAQVGFQDTGYVYVPEACKLGTIKCKLVVRADKCAPPSPVAPDVAELAAYAEANGIVVLHPCVGGSVDASMFPNAPDVRAASTCRQLTGDYAQSASQMRLIRR